MNTSPIERNKVLVAKASKLCIGVMGLITMAVLAYAVGDVFGMLSDWYMKTARPPLAYKAFMSAYRRVLFELWKRRPVTLWTCAGSPACDQRGARSRIWIHRRVRIGMGQQHP